MKVLLWLSGLVLALFGLLYVALFTPVGNDLVKPYIEEELRKQTNTEVELKKFVFGINSYDFTLKFDQYNTIEAEGTYSILTQSLYSDYKIKFEKLETLEDLLQKRLKGSVKAYGVAKGDKSTFTFYGDGVVASSDMRYHIDLSNLKVSSLIIGLKGAEIKELLELSNQHNYAEGKVDVDLNFIDVDPKSLNGNIKILSKDGNLNADFFKNTYNMDVPTAKFEVDVAAKIKNNHVDYTAKILSSIVRILSSGNVQKDTLETDVDYDIDTKEIALFKKLTKKDFQGPCNLKGTIKGNKKDMTIFGESSLADSDTKLTLTLDELKPRSLKGQMQNLDIRKTLYFFNKDYYGDGLLSLDIKLDDIRKGKRKGTVISTIREGKLNQEHFDKEKKFKSKMPRIDLAMNGYSVLNNDHIVSKVDLRSSIATIQAEKLVYNTQNKHLNSDYLVTVPDMDQLYFLTGQHIHSPMRLNGQIDKTDSLDGTLHTEFAKGKLDAKMHNDVIQASLKSMDTLELLKIFEYPKIFKALINVEVVYNKEEKSGSVKAAMSHGKFAPNNAFSLVEKYTKYNLYRENFKGQINANVKNEYAIASLALKSNKSSISTKNAKLNLKSKNIDSRIDIVANKNPISFELEGDASMPRVTVDIEELLKKRAKKDAKDRIDKFLKRIF